MRFVKAGLLLAAFVCWNAETSRASDCDNPRKDFASHEEKVRELGHELTTAVVGGDIEIFIELIGIPNVAKINELKLQIRRTKAPGLDDALAFEGRGCRSIIFDPYWASGDTPAFYLSLAHEAGHHFCGHTVGKGGTNSLERELEADEFSGASIRRYEIYHGRSFIDQVYAAALAKYPEQSPMYPPRALRLAAIKRGYEHGSHCGNLAPAVPGAVHPHSWTLAPAVPEAAPPPTQLTPCQLDPTYYGCAN